MPDDKSQSFFGRLAHSRLLLILEITILVLIAISFGKDYFRRYQVEREIADLQKEVGRLEERNIELAQLISYFQSDAYKERQARLRLGLTKEGESLLVLPGEATDSMGSTQVANAEGTQPSRTNPQKWWDYFFSPNNQNNKT